MAETRNVLTFHGKGSALFGRYLVNVLLSLVTLGIYSFWGKVKILQYQYEQTQLGGSPFRFLGTGGQLFVGYLKFLGVMLLTMVLPMVILFAVVFTSAMNGETETGAVLVPLLVFYAYLLLLVAVLIPIAVKGFFRYRLRVSSWRGITGTYRGLNKELIPMYLGGLLLTLVTLGIYGAWFQVKITKYVYSKISYGNLAVEFTGKGRDLFFIGLKGGLLMIITLGIYWFWYARNVYRWTAANTVIVQGETKAALSTPITAGALFKFWVPNLLLLVVTLGLAFPWFTVNSMKFFFANLTLPDAIDLETVAQGDTPSANSLGETMHDYLDLGDFGIL
jgi:uncharacterized membrane protein YjgN (DUF898 family)